MEEIVLKTSKWSKVWKVTTILSTIVITLAAIAYTCTGLPSGAADYRKSREAASQAGLFFTDSEADKLNSVLETQNADKILSAADVPDLGYASDLTPAIVRQKWSLIEPGLRKLEEARQRKYLIARRPANQMIFESTKSGTRASGWISKLMLLAKFSSAAGNFEETKHYIELAAYLADVLDDDHSADGLRRRASGAGQIEKLLARLVPRYGHDPKWLNFIDQTLRGLDKPYDCISVLKYEHFLAIGSANRISTDRNYAQQFAGEGNPQFKIGMALPRFKEANLARIHEFFTRIVTKIPRDPYDLKGLTDACESATPMYDEWQWSYTLLQYATSDMVSLGRLVSTEVASRNALMQAVAILKSKANPAKGLPIAGRYKWDLDLSPIRTKKLKQGWILYSIGNNRLDDGGMDSSSYPPDFVVHLSMATVPSDPKPKAAGAPGVPGRPPSVPAQTSGDY